MSIAASWRVVSCPIEGGVSKKRRCLDLVFYNRDLGGFVRRLLRVLGFLRIVRRSSSLGEVDSQLDSWFLLSRLSTPVY